MLMLAVGVLPLSALAAEGQPEQPAPVHGRTGTPAIR